MKRIEPGKLKNILYALPFVACSANALTLKFAFDGEFIMYDITGAPVQAASGVTGDMAMEIPLRRLLGPYPGSVMMQGEEPFFGAEWAAQGSMTGYQNLLFNRAPDYCGSHIMCADAAIDFSWNSQMIPVDASFGMDPNTGFSILDPLKSLRDSWANNQLIYFDVESLDADGDGVLGTAMATGPFTGFTPYFAGIATIVEFCVDNSGRLCTSMPPDLGISRLTPSAVPSAVPVPAAVWLFGSGLLGLAGVARRRKAAV